MKEYNIRISCARTAQGTHSFYLTAEDERVFLFNQPYYHSVHRHFCNGVRLEHALDFSKSGGDSAVIHTMSKLPMYIKYMEKEYDLPVLRQTLRKQNDHRARRSKNGQRTKYVRAKSRKVDFYEDLSL